MAFIVGFQDTPATDPQVVGRKFFHLAQASRAGFAVPPAVVIGTNAHRAYLAAGAWPEGLRGEVLAAGRSLGIQRGVSIRSSAVREDTADRSFAGQYRSFLEITTEAELLARIEECWASAGSETVRSYLRAIAVPGADAESPLLAVMIQKMVPSRIAGVAFSRNPLRPARDEMVIEAVRGHGEGLVSGRLTPCRAVLNGSGRVEVERPSRRHRRLAKETPWTEIAALLKRLEACHEGEALDMEWAVDPGRTLWLLQVRPITTLGREGDLPPAGSWTRKIADDLWADRLTPFMADVMTAHAPRFDLSAISRKIGIAPVQPALTVIGGYLYVNCAGIERAIAMIPRPLRMQYLQTLLPAEMPLEAIASRSLSESLRTALRMALLPLSEPGAIPFLCLRGTPRLIDRLRRRMQNEGSDTGGGAAALCERLRRDLETLALIQENNQWPYFHATVSAWVLRGLAAERPGGSPGADFSKLLGRGGDNVTLRIERWFRETAQRIEADPRLANRFREAPPDTLVRSLPEAFQKELDAFLKRYGCRSRHRTLLMKRWAEAPEEVVAILQSLVRYPQAHAAMPPGAAAPAKPRRLLRNPLLKLLVGLAQRFFDLREDLRFLMDEVLFRIRTDLLALGRRFGMDERIFFLKPAEIEEMAAGRLAPDAAANTAAQRRESYLKDSTPSTFWVDGRPEFDFANEGALLRGIGTSAGRATGRAVIVDDPSNAKIRRGDVVVARHTDPGWTPILSVIGGIVMEEGGLLNHCSIVARELGIPSVVGVSRATRLIPEGACVTVDGGAGFVKIEQG
jgi:pyruvate,water dikinase